MSAGDAIVGPQATSRLVCGQPDDSFALALIIKHTFTITPDGTCVHADEQEPITEDAACYDELESPLSSPPKCDNDCFAFKPATDVVIQGQAHTYGKPVRETVVEVHIRNLVRQIRVHGDRRCVRSGSGFAFTSPEPFSTMPIRYDRAYGGVDRVALQRQGDLLADSFRVARPEWQFDTMTWFHYPRNRAGTGYVMALDDESVQGVRVPNLEYPFDPVTPERMAAGSPEEWIKAPLPACFDWCDQSWFPRIAYLGLIAHHATMTEPPAEVRYGLAPADLMASESVLDLQMRHEFTNGAAPGLALPNLVPNEEITLVNMFPDAPQRTIRLPGLTPAASVEPRWKKKRKMKTRLLSIIIRPDTNQLVLVWSAITPVHRLYTPDQLAETPYWIDWR